VSETFNTNIEYISDHFQSLSEDIDHKNKIYLFCKSHLLNLHYKRVKLISEKKFSGITRSKFIAILDKNWMIQVNDLEYIKSIAGMYAYSGKNWKYHYIKLTYESFLEYVSLLSRELIKESFYLPLPAEKIVKNFQGKKIESSEAILELLK